MPESLWSVRKDTPHDPSSEHVAGITPSRAKARRPGPDLWRPSPPSPKTVGEGLGMFRSPASRHGEIASVPEGSPVGGPASAGGGSGCDPPARRLWIPELRRGAGGSARTPVRGGKESLPGVGGEVAAPAPPTRLQPRARLSSLHDRRAERRARDRPLHQPSFRRCTGTWGRPPPCRTGGCDFGNHESIRVSGRRLVPVDSPRKCAT